MKFIELFKKKPSLTIEKIASEIRAIIPSWKHQKINRNNHTTGLEIGSGPAGGEGYYDPSQNESGLYLTLSDDNNTIYIHDIGLSGEFAGKGYATKIVDRLIHIVPNGIVIDSDVSDWFWDRMKARYGDKITVSGKY